MAAERAYVPHMAQLMTAEELLLPHIPEHAELVRGAAFAPDLAVEILSPRDRAGETLTKVADWLSAGTLLVWVLDPVRRVARIYQQDGTELIIGERDALTGGDVLPGFTCPLSLLF